jgi:predicted membrane protein
MEEKAAVTPDEVVTDTITNLFTYANYFLVAALVVLLTYMTIRDFKKKQREKKLAQEREAYNNQFDNEDEKEEL